MASQTMSKTGILLEAGTNELEIITFSLQWINREENRIDRAVYGVNAAKVKQLVAMPEHITIISGSPDCVEGMFMLRSRTIPLINLCKWFKYEPDTSEEVRAKWTVVIAEMNGKPFGFITHGVDKVYRVSWKQIQVPPELVARYRALTGVCLIKDQLIQMVDFENLIAHIDPSMRIVADTEKESTGEKPAGKREERPTEAPANAAPSTAAETVRASSAPTAPAVEAAPVANTVIAVDDSRTILMQLKSLLKKAGYAVVTHSDGQSALDYLMEQKAANAIDMKHTVVISDIEMPRMDGHHFCMRVKQDPVLRDLPVILFSSLINDALRKKGETVGADEQIAKSEINTLPKLLEKAFTRIAA